MEGQISNRKLEALKGSDTDSFYRVRGFLKTGESEWDTAYRWRGESHV